MTGPVSSNLRANWPHALLLHGRAGIGKLQFAQHLAQSLLCESPTDTREPCGHCVACLWFSQGNHPDYRAVLPEALAGELISDEKAGRRRRQENQSAEQGNQDRPGARVDEFLQSGFASWRLAGRAAVSRRIDQRVRRERFAQDARRTARGRCVHPGDGAYRPVVADDHQPLPPMADVPSGHRTVRRVA